VKLSCAKEDLTAPEYKEADRRSALTRSGLVRVRSAPIARITAICGRLRTSGHASAASGRCCWLPALLGVLHASPPELQLGAWSQVSAICKKMSDRQEQYSGRLIMLCGRARVLARSDRPVGF